MRGWGVHINFKIHGQGSINGDGIAFWYSKERMMPGPVFGSKDYFSGLGVFIDTFGNHVSPSTASRSESHRNHEHPYISIIVNNGSQKYDHDHDGGHQNLGGCSVKVRNKNSTQILVRYDISMLTVLRDVDGKGLWDICAQVDGIELPTGYYFGLSAATGDLSDNHDIFYVQVRQLGCYQGSENPRGFFGKAQPRGFWLFCGFLGGCGFLWVFINFRAGLTKISKVIYLGKTYLMYEFIMQF